MRTHPVALLTAFALAVLPPARAPAQSSTEARLRDALRSTTAQLRAAEDERARLQASVAALQDELAAAKAQVARRAAPRTSPREIEELNAKLAEAARRIAEQGEGSRGLSDALAACRSTAQDAARGREEAEAGRRALGERLAAVESKNARLYAVGRSIIDWLARIGFGQALAAREPFLGLKRVELENAAQDWEDKLLDERVKPGDAAPHAAARTGGP